MAPVVGAVLPATAQQQSDAESSISPQIEEVVVTARLREERLQEIPLSIAAFSAENIREVGARDLGDLTKLASGVVFRPRASGGIGGRINSNIRVRGISGGGLPHLQPVSLFVDGVYALGGANVIPVHNLERVEIIKGPQSAFFGRNTFAGAINYVTKQPSLSEYRTQIDVSAATREQFDVSVFTSGPIVEDRLAFSADLRAYTRGRQFTATDGGALGEENSKSGAFGLYAKPTDDLSIKARVYYQEDDDGPAASAFFQAGLLAPNCLGRQVQGLDTNGAPVTRTLGAFWCGQVPEPGEQFAPVVSTNTSVRPGSFAQVRRAYDARTGTLLPAASRPDFLIENTLRDRLLDDAPSLDRMGVRRDTLRTSLNVDYEFESGYVASMVGGYNKMGLNYLIDYDRTDAENWYSSDPQSGRDYSMEMRLASPASNRLRWLSGATYYNQEFIAGGAGGTLISSCISGLAGFPAAGVCDEARNGVGPVITTTPLTGGDLAEVWGIFGSVSYDFTDTLTLDIEGRYMEDKRTTTLLAGTYSDDLATTYKQWTPRVILSYKPTQSTTLYGQLSRGVLPGVLNGLVAVCSRDEFLTPYVSPITGQLSTASECAQLASQLPGGKAIASTPSQELNAIEIGLKQSVLDDQLRFNLTGYVYEWKNLISQQRPILVRDATDPNARDGIPNAFATTLGVSVPGSQQLYGLEFESGYAVTSNLDVQLNVSWNKNEWKKFKSTTSSAYYPFDNLKGKEQMLYPEWLANLTVTYGRALTDRWDWYTRTDVNYTGKQWADLPNLASINDYALVNAAVGFKHDELRVELFARNLTGEDSWATGERGIDFAQVGDWAWRHQGIGLVPQDKRSFGVRLSHSF